MKMAFLAVMLIGSIILGTHQVEAQAYGPYYIPSWYEAQYQGYAQEYDPYYALHVLHYQLYLSQYQYQPYPIYPSCCFAGGCCRPIVVNADHSAAKSDYQSATTSDEKAIKRLCTNLLDGLFEESTRHF